MKPFMYILNEYKNDTLQCSQIRVCVCVSVCKTRENKKDPYKFR